MLSAAILHSTKVRPSPRSMRDPESGTKALAIKLLQEPLNRPDSIEKSGAKNGSPTLLRLTSKNPPLSSQNSAFK